MVGDDAIGDADGCSEPLLCRAAALRTGSESLPEVPPWGLSAVSQPSHLSGVQHQLSSRVGAARTLPATTGWSLVVSAIGDHFGGSLRPAARRRAERRPGSCAVRTQGPQGDSVLKSISVKAFKSLVDLELELGRINVFIGANGSGKSNLLEALGVLGAAASGRVDDEALLRRGVRPGVPRLYKTAFPGVASRPHINFGASTDVGASFEVTLWNPLESPSPAWRFKTENLRRGRGDEVSTRSTTTTGKHNQEQGLAALETVSLEPGDPALALMDLLRSYSIYCPNTPSLRGLVQDLQAREPVGLSGGRLPEAVNELIETGRGDGVVKELLSEVRELIDWARDFSTASSVDVPLSPSAARSRRVIRFVDRFMARGRNSLTGYDASEGALYVLFCAALALHPKAPACLAIDNVDQTLNPRLATQLMTSLCSWTTRISPGRQWLLTAHNPAILDGLPLGDPGVRLFTVDRDSRGHSMVEPVHLDEAVRKRPGPEWTLSRMWLNGLLGGVPSV